MRDDLAVRVVLALTLTCAVNVAALTVGEVLALCQSRSEDVVCNHVDMEGASCNFFDSDSECQYPLTQERREARSLSKHSPTFYQTTTTTTRDTSSSIVWDARVQWDLFFGPDPDVSHPTCQFCMFDTGSEDSFTLKRVIQMFFSVFHKEIGVPTVTLDDGTKKPVNPSVMYVKAQDTWEANFMLLDTIVVQIVGTNCIWLGVDEREFDILNDLAAEFTRRASHLMLAPGPMKRDVLKVSPRVFSLAPHPTRFLDMPLDIASRTGYANTVAYIYIDNEFDRQKCSRIDELAPKLNYEVVYSVAVNATKPIDLVNATLDLKSLNPDVVIFCTDIMDNITSFVDTLYDERIQPRAVIIASALVSHHEYWTRLSAKGQYIIGVDLWAVALNTTSDLIFTNISNQQAAGILRQQAGQGFTGLLKSKYMLLLTTLELSIWALQHAVYDALSIIIEVSVEPLLNVLLSLKDPRRRRRSFIGDILWDEIGERVTEYLAVQWQQQRPGAASPYVLGDEDEVQVVAPAEWASQWLWFPKPKWDNMACYRTDTTEGTHGFKGVDMLGEYTDCGECDLGSLGTNKIGIVFGLEAFGPINIRVCEKCPAGQFSQKTSMAGMTIMSCQECAPGKITMRAGQSTCKACKKGRYQDDAGNSQCDLCQIGKFNDKVGETECVECQFPQVSVIKGSMSCTECPEGADCPMTENGYSTYMSKNGFYILNIDNGLSQKTWDELQWEYPLGVVYTCPYNVVNCLQNNTCSDPNAMHGPLCGTCKPGFQKGGAYQACSKCPPTVVQIIYIMLQHVWYTAIGLVMYFECIVSKTHHDHQVMIVLKQILTYSWLMYRFAPWLFYDMGGTFGKEVIDTFRISSESYHCLLAEIGPDHEVAYSLIVAAYIFLPICLIQILFTLCIQWPIAKCLTGNQRVRSVPVKDSVIALSLVIFYQIHVRFTADVLEVFRCLKYDVNRLVWNPSILCESEDHRYWQTVAGIGLVLVSLGLPVLFFIIMRSHRNLWDTPGMRTYGFLHLGYKHEFWYWETVLMIRKVIFAGLPMMPIFQGAEAHLQSRNNARRVVLLTISIAFYVINQLCKPWDVRSFLLLQHLEEAQLQAFIIMFALQILQQDLYGKDVNQLKYDITCRTVLVLTWLVHLRFWVFAIRGLVGPICGKRISRVCGSWFKRNKRMVIRKEGIDATGLGQRSRQLLVGFFGRIARIHLDNGDMFDIKEFVKSVQTVCTMAGYFKSLENSHGWLAGEVYDDHTDLVSSLTQEEIRKHLRDAEHPSGENKQGGGELERGKSSITSFTDVTTLTRDSDARTVLAAQTKYELYHDMEISPAAVFRSYLRERKKIGEEVKERSQQMITKSHVQEGVNFSEAFDPGDDDKEEEAVEETTGELKKPMSRLTNVFKDSLQDANASEAHGGFELPHYRVLASHMRELQAELNSAMEENAELLIAVKHSTQPMKVEALDEAEQPQMDKKDQTRRELIRQVSPPPPPPPADTLLQTSSASTLVVIDESDAVEAPSTLEDEPVKDSGGNGPAMPAENGTAEAIQESLTISRTESLTMARAIELAGGQAGLGFAEEEEMRTNAKREQELRAEIETLKSQIEEEEAQMNSEMEEGSMPRDPSEGAAHYDDPDRLQPLKLSERPVQHDSAERAGTQVAGSSFPVQSRQPKPKQKTSPPKTEVSAPSSSARVASPKKAPKGKNGLAAQEHGKHDSHDDPVGQVSAETAKKLEAVKKEIDDLQDQIKRCEKESMEMTAQISAMHNKLEGKDASDLNAPQSQKVKMQNSLWERLGR